MSKQQFCKDELCSCKPYCTLRTLQILHKPSSVFNLRACIGFQMGALCEAGTWYIPWSTSGCGAAICYSTRDTWHVAVAMTWQPSVSSLYSNPCLETLILDESHLLLLLSHQSHKICSFLVLNVYGILCLNILLIYFGKKLSLHRETERDNRFQAFLC